MRKFGNDVPRFMAFTLGDGEEVYKLPLAASMPMETLLELQEAADDGADAFEHRRRAFWLTCYVLAVSHRGSRSRCRAWRRQLRRDRRHTAPAGSC